MQPIELHPQNPHYFRFRGRPTVLVTSAEHYGAVLNLDFDYIPYLDELRRRGFNLTRVFSGSYVENPGAFAIKNNTLAPPANRFIAPWARSTTPGYLNGGNKFDLARWNSDYFARLRDFVGEAGRRGIVVEMVLFCPYYEDSMWQLSPLNSANNINGIGNVARTDALTMKHPPLVAVHDALTRKVVDELKSFDNLYYEICNEPYFGGVTLDWQHHIADTISAAEARLPFRHLIAQNIANGSSKIEKPHPMVSVFNFHYANPPDAVAVNYHLNKPIGFDETGFKGSADLPYRTDGWEFMLAGGAVYNNLDYSFTTAAEDGTARPEAPGGGGPALRQQLQALKSFVESFNFVRMKPDNAVISGLAGGVTARAMAEPGRAYAVYLKGGIRTDVNLDMPGGFYRCDWVNTQTGRIDKVQQLHHRGGEATLSSPPYREDVALRVTRQQPH